MKCKICGRAMSVERAFGTRDEEFYYTCNNCEYNPKEDKMIVIKTDMTTMPGCCKECTLCDKTIVTKEYYCKELLEDITDIKTKLNSCPLIEIGKACVCYKKRIGKEEK